MGGNFGTRGQEWEGRGRAAVQQRASARGARTGEVLYERVELHLLVGAHGARVQVRVEHDDRVREQEERVAAVEVTRDRLRVAHAVVAREHLEHLLDLLRLALRAPAIPIPHTPHTGINLHSACCSMPVARPERQGQCTPEPTLYCTLRASRIATRSAHFRSQEVRWVATRSVH